MLLTSCGKTNRVGVYIEICEDEPAFAFFISVRAIVYSDVPLLMGSFSV